MTRSHWLLSFLLVLLAASWLAPPQAHSAERKPRVRVSFEKKTTRSVKQVHAGAPRASKEVAPRAVAAAAVAPRPAAPAVLAVAASSALVLDPETDQVLY